MTVLMKSSCRTYSVVSLVEVAHFQFPILLVFKVHSGRETVEYAWGQGSTRLGSGDYRDDQ